MAEELRELADYLEASDFADASRDVYGSGALVNDFEQDVAAQLGMPAALFLPSGTLAQPLALRIHADQAQLKQVGLHATSHLLLHEQSGYRALWNLKHVEIGTADKVPQLADLEALDAAALAAVVLELPMREIGGQLPSWEELVAQSDWARQNGVALHLDGARLWQCPAYYQRPLAEITALFDSVYVSFYKDLGGIAGAMLLGSEGFIDQARIWNRRAGGNIYTLYPLLLAAKKGLAENLEILPAAVCYARELGQLLEPLAGVTVNPASPQTAMFHLHVQGPIAEVLTRTARYAERTGIVVLPEPRAEQAGCSICEINIGPQAMEQSPQFWAQHLQEMLKATS